MGDWSFLGRLLENAQEHSTVIGKVTDRTCKLDEHLMQEAKQLRLCPICQRAEMYNGQFLVSSYISSVECSNVKR